MNALLFVAFAVVKIFDELRV